MSAIIDTAVADHLEEQHDRGLRVILVNRGHVQVIDKKLHLSISRWSKSPASSFFQISFQHDLQTVRVSVGVEVHGSGQHVILELRQEVFDYCGFCSTSDSTVKNGFPSPGMESEGIFLTLNLCI